MVGKSFESPAIACKCLCLLAVSRSYVQLCMFWPLPVVLERDVQSGIFWLFNKVDFYWLGFVWKNSRGRKGGGGENCLVQLSNCLGQGGKRSQPKHRRDKKCNAILCSVNAKLPPYLASFGKECVKVLFSLGQSLPFLGSCVV